MPDGQREIARSTSETIRIARVIGILAVIYVHTPPYAGPYPYEVPYLRVVTWAIIEMLGRSSVPLLSVISGYLLVRLGSDRRPWKVLMAAKVRSLIVPLFAWNLIALVLGLALGKGFPPLVELPDELLAISGFPAIDALYFLRSIFICFALSPFFVLAMRWPVPTLAAIASVAILNLDGALFFNNALPLFFAIGVGIGRGSINSGIITAHPRISAALAFVTLASVINLYSRGYGYIGGYDPLTATMDIVQRLAGAVVFWTIATFIQQKPEANRAVIRIEPFIFFIFCSHPLVVSALWKIIERTGAEPGTFLHLSFFLITPALVLIIAVPCVIAMRLICPAVLKPLMGGRLPELPGLASLRKQAPPA